MEGLKRVNEFLNNAIMFLGGITLVLMMAIACVNMVLRLVGTPISAAFELVGYLGALTVSLPLGYAQLKKSHIAVDILSSRFSPGVRKVTACIGSFLGAAFFFVVAWQLGVYAETLREAGELSETLRIPYYPFTYGVAVACALMTLCMIVDFVSLIVPERKEGT